MQPVLKLLDELLFGCVVILRPQAHGRHSGFDQFVVQFLQALDGQRKEHQSASESSMDRNRNSGDSNLFSKLRRLPRLHTSYNRRFTNVNYTADCAHLL